jgi:restriction system protein
MKAASMTWSHLDVDLSKLRDRDELTKEMRRRYPDAKPKAIANWVS